MPTDHRSPAQVAEEEEREARKWSDATYRIALEAGQSEEHATIFCDGLTEAITRALAARAWETASRLHVKNCACCNSPSHANHIPVDPRCESQRSVLKKKYESLNE